MSITAEEKAGSGRITGPEHRFLRASLRNFNSKSDTSVMHAVVSGTRLLPVVICGSSH